MADGCDVVAVQDAHRRRPAIVIVRLAEPLDLAVDRVALDPRRVVHHLDHRLDRVAVLLDAGVGAAGPVGAVVELGDPDRPLRHIVDALEVIVELGGGSGRVRGTPVTAVVVDRHVIHPHAGRVGLVDEIDNPVVAAIRHRRGAHPQPGGQQVGPRGDRSIDRAVVEAGVRVLIRAVGFVVAEQVVDAPPFPVLVKAGPPTGLADGRILPIGRGVRADVPVVVPVGIEGRGGDVARAFLARPAPREDAHEADRGIEAGWHRCDDEVAVLRDIVLASAAAVFILREGGGVAALEDERADRAVERTQRSAVVGGVGAEQHRPAHALRRREHLERPESGGMRNHHRTPRVLDDADVRAEHRGRAVDLDVRQQRRSCRRRHRVKENPRVGGVEMDRAARERIPAAGEVQLRVPGHGDGRVRQRGGPQQFVVQGQRLRSRGRAEQDKRRDASDQGGSMRSERVRHAPGSRRTGKGIRNKNIARMEPCRKERAPRLA